MAGSPGRSSGVGPSGRVGRGLPQRWSNAGIQRGLSTPASRIRYKLLPDVRDSGIDTGGSWVPDDRRLLESRGVGASTPMPGGKYWTHERRVSRYSPITDSDNASSPGWCGFAAKDAKDGNAG